MKKTIFSIFLILMLNGCITVPVNTNQANICEVSTDMKTLKIVDVAKESNSYYSISGVILSPILIPTTAIISGVYVIVNNVYHLGEKRIKCGSEKI